MQFLFCIHTLKHILDVPKSQCDVSLILPLHTEGYLLHQYYTAKSISNKLLIPVSTSKSNFCNNPLNPTVLCYMYSEQEKLPL
jgi:hypothetical protein